MTHTRKDGTFVDDRAAALVLEVESVVDEQLLDNASPVDNSQTTSITTTSNTCHLLLNQKYIKRGQTRKGTVYGLGSSQFKDSNPFKHVDVSLKRSVDMEMCITGLETHTEAIKAELSALKTDFKIGIAETRAILNAIFASSLAATDFATRHPPTRFSSCIYCSSTIATSTSTSTSSTSIDLKLHFNFKININLNLNTTMSPDFNNLIWIGGVVQNLVVRLFKVLNVVCNVFFFFYFQDI